MIDANKLSTPNAIGWLCGAFGVYAAISAICIGHGRSLTKGIFGAGGDPLQFIWFFKWWPFAIAHHINPFFCNFIWQPLGVPMLWVTSVPLLALLALPVTLGFGPVPAYNLLVLAAPVFSATAAFSLCVYITKSFRASLFGGFLFGFSSYETAADLATINLSFTALLPCLVLLGLVRLDGAIARGPTIALASAMLVAEFFISIEIFATAIFFTCAAWALAFWIFAERRAALQILFVDSAITGLVTLFILSPFLVSMADDRKFVHLPDAWPYFFTADLLNFILPTQLTWLGGNADLPITKNFAGGLQEQDAYLGLPLILILLLFARENISRRIGAFLLASLAVLILASLGPRLWIGGTLTPLVLPWLLMVKLPLLGAALPTRFALFVSLAAGVAGALWIAARPANGWRLWLGFLACFALLPARHPWTKLPNLIFFKPGRVETVLGPEPRLLVLPFGGQGGSTYWQAEQNFGYAQTGGYLGFPPAAMQHFAAVGELFGGTQGPHFTRDLWEFCAATNTEYVIAAAGTSPALFVALARLAWPAQKIDDVTIFKVPQAGASHG